MGIFSGLTGGGGSAKRAAQAAADKAAEARTMVREGEAKYGAYYDPYRAAGESAMGSQQTVLNDVSGRISALDPKIAGLNAQQAALQPQADEMYTLAQQQDPILAKLLSGNMDAYKDTPGYKFRMQEGQKALEQSAAAKGQLFSGQTGKALQQYGQDYGTNEYDNYLARTRANLNDVNTQMGGRQTALNAGQGQVNAGVNMLAQDYNQIAAQMGVSDAYQNLVNNGMTAADAAAKLGMDAVNVQAGLTKGIGETYASGMIEKDKQMKSSGDAWLNMGSAAVGAMTGKPMPTFNTGGAVSNPYGGSPSQGPTQPSFMQQPSSNTGQMGRSFMDGFSNPTAFSMQPQGGTYGPTHQGYQAQPCSNPDKQQQAALSATTGYKRSFV